MPMLSPEAAAYAAHALDNIRRNGSTVVSVDPGQVLHPFDQEGGAPPPNAMIPNVAVFHSAEQMTGPPAGMVPQNFPGVPRYAPPIAEAAKLQRAPMTRPSRDNMTTNGGLSLDDHYRAMPTNMILDRQRQSQTAF
jgi:hypothetical protein